MAGYTTVTALWEGTTGLPGYTKMKWNGPLNTDDCALAAAKQKTFFGAVGSLLPQDINISWDGIGQQFDDQGVLIGEVGYTAPTSLAGSSASPYASPLGMCVDWLTNDFINGRRLRGRTYLVPLSLAAFAADGTPAASAVSQIATAAANLVAGDPLLVINGGGIRQPDGSYIDKQTKVVLSSAVPDRAAVLRSRRD